MRGKVAKRLRREAKARTVGLPERQLGRRKDGSIINMPGSTRGMYHAFKRAFKKGLINLGGK